MTLREFLYDALASSHGIVVRSISAERLRAKLYPLRKEDAEFLTLSFVLSPDNPDHDLWIVKKVKSNGEA